MVSIAKVSLSVGREQHNGGGKKKVKKKKARQRCLGTAGSKPVRIVLIIATNALVYPVL